MASNAELMLSPEQDQSPQLTPVLKWAGGKRWLVPHLKKLYAPHHSKRLVEPFVGGMAVSLGLLPRKALLSDVNPHAINLYRWLQSGLTIRTQMKNDSEYYYRSRKRFNKLIEKGGAESAEAAGLFYYLNRTGYNGLCRFNSRGFLNVPFGRYTKINYTKNFLNYQKTLSQWKFQCGDFEKLRTKAGDFLYADPPYDVEFTQYSQGGFTWDDQERLAHWLSKHKGPVVTSNQATPRIISLYKKLKFQVLTVSAPRMISCTGERARVHEIIAMKGL